MLCIRSRFCKLTHNYCKYMVQWSSSSSAINFPELSFQPRLSPSDQKKILETLNESDNTKLSSLNVAKSKIKSLESYKKRKGPFKSLDELLEVDGVNMKNLEKLCMQIIADAPSLSAKSIANENKKLKQLLVPPLPLHISETLNSTVGIHVAPMGVSWAKITQSTLESWGHQGLENLPKKLCPTDTFKLAMNILSQLPSGDAYVFEGTNNIGPQSQKQPATVTSYTLQLELSSMLLALINTSIQHNSLYQDDSTKYDLITNCVYFLRSKVPARLFRTLVGNECVSNNATILHLLGEAHVGNLVLPCSPIVVEKDIKTDYLAQPPAHKELLGQALMLTVAFKDLCVKKNPASIKALMPGKK